MEIWPRHGIIYAQNNIILVKLFIDGTLSYIEDLCKYVLAERGKKENIWFQRGGWSLIEEKEQELKAEVTVSIEL